MTIRKPKKEPEPQKRSMRKSRKQACLRPIAMLLVFVMFLGTMPAEALGLIGQAWGMEAGTQQRYSGESDSGEPGSDEIDTAMPDVLDGPAKDQVTFDREHDIYSQGPLEIDQDGVYHVHSSANKASTANRITIQSGVTATVYLGGINIATTTGPPIDVMTGARVTLVLVDGSENTLKNSVTTATAATAAPGIHVPEGSLLIIQNEMGGSSSLVVRGGYACAGIGGYGGTLSDPEGKPGGNIIINGGNLDVEGGWDNPAATQSGYYAGGAAIGGGGGYTVSSGSGARGGDSGTIVVNGGVINSVVSAVALGGGNGSYGRTGASIAVPGNHGGDNNKIVINGGEVRGYSIGGGLAGSRVFSGKANAPKGGNGGVIEIHGGLVACVALGGGICAAYSGQNTTVGRGGDGGKIIITGGHTYASHAVGAGRGRGMEDGEAADITISSGSLFAYLDTIEANQVKIQGRPVHSFENGEELYATTVEVRDYQNALVADARVWVEVTTKDGEQYTYETITAGQIIGNQLGGGYAPYGRAFIWLPASTEAYTVYAEHDVVGGGSKEVNIGEADTNSVVIEMDPVQVFTEKVPETKTYTPVTLNIKTVNGAGGTNKELEEVLWFRTSGNDVTRYNAAAFVTAYNEADDRDKGSSKDEGSALVPLGSDNELEHNFTMEATENGCYWFLAKYRLDDSGSEYQTAVGTSFVNNIYTITPIYVRGRIGSTDQYLYGSATSYESVSGIYSVPFDLHGEGVLESPSDGYSQVEIPIRDAYRNHWEAFLKDGTPLAQSVTVELGPDFFDPDENEISDDEYNHITIRYEKLDTGNNWRIINAVFVNETEGLFEVEEGLSGETFEAPVNAAGDSASFYDNGGRYLPPSNSEYYPVGFIVGGDYKPGDNYIPCADFHFFNPQIPSQFDTVYIVYKKDTVTVKERYLIKDTAMEFPATAAVLEAGQPYEKQPVSRYAGYVEVGYEIRGTGMEELDVYHPLDVSQLEPNEPQHGKLKVEIDKDTLLAAEGDVEVWYYYEPEMVDDSGNGTGIPKSQGARIEERHSGAKVNFAAHLEYTDLFETKVHFVRTGIPLVLTNDGSDEGKNPYHIAAPTEGAPNAKWIFDNSQPVKEGGNEKREFTPTGDDVVTFYYFFDTQGEGTPDVQQYVMEEYINETEDQQQDVWRTRKVYVLKGKTYSQTVEEYRYDGDTGEPSFILFGVQVDDEEMVRPGPAISMETSRNQHTVQFLYREAAKLSFKWEGKSYSSGHLSNLTDPTSYFGFIGEEVTDKVKEALERDFPGWNFVDAFLDDRELFRPQTEEDDKEGGEGGGDQGEGGETPEFPQLLLTKDPQAFQANYLEIPKKAYINVYGIILEGDTQTQRYYIAHEPMQADNPITIPLIQFENYQISMIEIESEEGTAEIPYPEANYLLQADPKDGDQTIRIYYENVLQEVTVYKRYFYDKDADVTTPDTVSQVRGESYTAEAPFISGHQLVDEAGNTVETLSQTIVVGDEDEDHNNEIYFYYVDADGMLEVYYEDEETGQPLGGRNVEIKANEEITIQPKDDIDYYISVSADEIIEWNGNPEDFPDSITFYYRRERTTVKLEAWDQKFNVPVILDALDPEDPLEEPKHAFVKDDTVRIHEYYAYEEKAKELDAIVLDIEATVYSPAPRGSGVGIMAKEADSEDNVVQVWYIPASDDSITVEVYADSAAGELLYSYPYHGSKGQVVEFDADYIREYVKWRGFELDESHSDNNWTATIGGRDKIVIILEDKRHTVEVYTNTGSGDVFDHSYKVVSGDTQIVSVPNVEDHLMTGYKVGNEAELEAEFKEFETGQIYSNLKIIFYYKLSEEVVKDRYVDVVVYGRPESTTNTPLYQYTKRVLKENREYLVIQDQEVFGLAPQWVLKDGERAKQTFNPSAYQNPINFIYTSNIRTVTVQAREFVAAGNDSGAQLINPAITVPDREIGKAYTHIAPTIPGYVVVDRNGNKVNGAHSETITVSSGDVPNQITFYYVKAEGNLSVTYEDAITGEKLGWDSVTLAAGTVDKAIDIPEIPYYNPPTVKELRSYDGIADPAPVKYQYTRKEAAITVQAVDWVTGADIVNGDGDGLTADTEPGRVMESIAAGKLSAALDELDGLVAELAENPGDPAHSRITALNYAIVSDQAGENQIKIYYNPPAEASVTVQIWAEEADGSNKIMLHAYPVPAAAGAEVVFTENQAPILPGYNFRKDLSVLAVKQTAGTPIKLVYVDERIPVSVYTQTTAAGSSPALERVERLTLEEAAKYTLNVYYKDGHVLKSYTVKNEDGESGPTPWASAAIFLGKIEKKTEVHLLYETIEEAVNSEVSLITVFGVVKDPASPRHGEQLYTFTKQVARTEDGDPEYKVIADGDMPSMEPTWRLPEAEKTKQIFNPDGNREITFEYEENLVELTLRAVDWPTKDAGSGRTELLDPVVKEVVRGEAVSHSALKVPGYTLVNEDGSTAAVFSRDFTADRDNDQLVFYYKQATGNLLVRYIDKYVKDGVTIEKEIGWEYLDLAANETRVIQIPGTAEYNGPIALTHYDPQPGQDLKTRHFDGSTPLQEVKYYFDKAKVKVTLQAVDSVTGAVIEDDDGQSVEHEFYARVEEHADYAEYLNQLTAKLPSDGGYAISYQASASTYVEVNESKNVVQVAYVPAKGAYVLVELYADIVSAANLIYNYTIPARPGEEVQITKYQLPNLPGYVLDESATPESSLKGVAGGEDDDWKIIAVMEDQHIRISVVAEPAAAVAGAGLSNPVAVQKELPGTNVSVPVPYLAEYTLKSYQSDALGGQPADGSGLSKIPLGTLNQSTELKLTYIKLEDAVDEEYITITINGIAAVTANGYDEGDLLYTYEKRVSAQPGADGLIEVLDAGEIQNLRPTWKLLLEEEEKETAGFYDPEEGTNTLNFRYGNNLETVTVHTVLYNEIHNNKEDYDLEGEKLLEAIRFPNWESGTPFTYKAPNIPGYTPVDVNGNKAVETGVLNPVTSEDNSLVFYYIKSEGNLLVQHYDDSGNLLAETRQELAADVSKEAERITVAYHDAPDAQSVTYNGVDEPTPVRYTYTRRKAAVELAAYSRVGEEKPILNDNGGMSAIITAKDVEKQPVMSIYNMTDLRALLTSLVHVNNPDYTPLGTDMEFVVSDAQTHELKILYEPHKKNSVLVNIWIEAVGEEGEEPFRSYRMPITVGDSVTIMEKHKPDLTAIGYEVDLDLPGTVDTAQDGGVITLIAKDHGVTLNVAAAEAEKESDALDGLLSWPSSSTRVVDGTKEYQIGVPYIPGYTLSSYTINGQSSGGSLVSGSLILDEIDGETDVVFYFEDTEEMIDNKYSLVTIRGLKDVDGLDPDDPAEEHILYSYTKRVEKDTEQDTRVVKDPAQELYQFGPKWKLEDLDDDDSKFYLRVTEPTHVMNFLYDDQERIVQIVLEDEDGNLIDSQGKPTEGHEKQPTVTGYLKETVSITAPVVPGWQLLNQADYSKPCEVKEAGNQVTFRYRKMTGSLYIQLVDPTTAAVILQYTPDIVYDAGTTFDQVMADKADWFAAAPRGWLYRDENPEPLEKDDEAGFPLETGKTAFLTYELKPDMRPVTVRHIDEDGLDIAAQKGAVEGQLGSRVMAAADPVDLPNGYVLQGAPYDYLPEVTGDSEKDVILFTYKDLGETGIGKVYAVGLLEDKETGIYYREVNINGLDPGDTFYVDLPVINGYPEGRWDQDSAGERWIAEKKQVEAILDRGGMQIRFLYGDAVWVDIPVHAVDKEGNQLEGVAYQSYTDPVLGSVGAENSTAYRFHTAVKDREKEPVYAPVIAGYELIPEQTDPFIVPVVGAADQPKVVFRYQPISTNYVTVTVINYADGAAALTQKLLYEKGLQTISAPSLPGYELDRKDPRNYQNPQGADETEWGAFGAKTRDLQRDEDVEFYFLRHERDITVVTLDQEGRAIGDYATAAPLTVPGRVEEQVLVHAPVAPGYKLSEKKPDETPQRRTQPVTVSEKGPNEAKFYYEPLKGNVLIQLVDEDNYKTILHQDAVYLQKDMTKDEVLEALKDLLPQAPAGWDYAEGGAVVTDPADFTVSEDAVVIVKYPLEKVMADLLVFYLKYPGEGVEVDLNSLQPEDHVAQPKIQSVQLAQRETILAKPEAVESGWVLMGDPYDFVQMPEEDDGSLSHIFFYEYKGDDGVGQIYLMGWSPEGQILYYENFTPTGAEVPGRYTIKAPLPENWKLAAGQDPEISVETAPYNKIYDVHYERIPVTVELRLTDEKGARLDYEVLPDSLKYLDGPDGSGLTYKVINPQQGVSFAMTAPSIPHYQLRADLSEPAGAVGQDGGVLLAGSEMKGTVQITFTYQDVESLVEEGYVYVNLEGRVLTGTEEAADDRSLYKDRLRIAREPGGDTIVRLAYGIQVKNQLPTYDLIREDKDGYRWEDDEYVVVIGEDDPAEVDLRFNYRENTTTVYVKTLLYDPDSGEEKKVGPAQAFPEVKINSTFVYNAPVVPGYQLVYYEGELAGENRYDYSGSLVFVSPTNNTLTFYYKKAVLNQKVIQMEVHSGGKETVLGVYYVDVDKDTKSVSPVKVDYYDLVDDAPQPVIWDGTGADPEDICFYYVRQKQDVTLTAYDANNGKAIKDENDEEISIVIENLPVMSAYDYIKGDLASLDQKVQAEAAEKGFSLVTPLEETSIFVAPAESAEKNQIKIFFRKPAAGRIPVNIWIDPNEAGQNWELLYAYETPAEERDVVELSDLKIHDLTENGFIFDPEKSTPRAQVLGGSDPDVTAYKFDLVYNDARMKVTVKTAVNGGVPEEIDGFKVVSGSTAKVTIPGVYEHAMTSYEVKPNPDTVKEEDSLLILEGVKDHTEVVFHYEPSTGNEENFLVVEVRHEDLHGNELYPAESLIRLKHSEHVIAAKASSSYVPVAAYVDGEPVKQSGFEQVTVAAGDQETIGVTFVYALAELYSGTVIIHKVNEEGEDLEKPDTVRAIAGQPFTSTAPYFEGYYILSSTEELEDGSHAVLEGTTIGLVREVSDDPDNPSAITFTYRSVDGEDENNGKDGNNVFVRARELPDENSSYSKAGDIKLIKGEGQVKDGVYILDVPDLEETDYYLFHSTDLPLLEPLVLPEAEPDALLDESGGDDDDSDGNDDGKDENEEGGNGHDTDGGAEVTPPTDPDIPDPTDPVNPANPDENGGSVDQGSGADGSGQPNEQESGAGFDAEERQGSSETNAAPSVLTGGLGSGGQVLSRSRGSRPKPAETEIESEDRKGIYYDEAAHKIRIYGYDPDAFYEIEVYYLKNVTDIRIVERIDGPEGDRVREPWDMAARKGEAVLVTAQPISGYAVSAEYPASLMVLALDGEDGKQPEAEFYYNAVVGGTASITVRATGDGKPLTGAKVLIKRIDGDEAVVITGDDDKTVNGRFYQNSLKPGVYEVTVTASGYGSKTWDNELAGGTNWEPDFDFVKEKGGGGGGGTIIVKEDPEPKDKEEEEDMTPADLQELLELMIQGEHVAYITGYGDSTVRPDGSITRAEAAQMLYQLMKPYLDEDFAIGGAAVMPRSVSYSDVTGGQWYSAAVSALSSYGILSGYPDGTFRPEDPITRAEFTVIVSQLAALRTGAHGFEDALGHWAEKYIANAAVRGWISGYPDPLGGPRGSFRPENEITRGEAASILNRMLGRRIHKDDIPVSVRKFSDLSSAHWAYEDIVEAANAHRHERGSDGYELWK